MAKKVNRIKKTTRTVEQHLASAALDSIWGLAIAKAPFLSLPIVKQISRFTLEKILFWLTGEGIIWFNSVWMRIQISREFADLENERQLAILALDEGLSDEELADIDEALIDAFRKAHRVGRSPL